MSARQGKPPPVEPERQARPEMIGVPIPAADAAAGAASSRPARRAYLGRARGFAGRRAPSGFLIVSLVPR
jgi:hypothetical protein